MEKKQNMITGNPAKSLILFTLPIVLGNLFQQLYSIVDTIVVGNYVGSDALAAVGTSTTITFLFVAIATGASIGCSVVISQLYGARRIEEMKTSIYTAAITVFTISAILSVLGLLVNPFILRLLNTPDEIMPDALLYLNIYFAGLCFLFMYNIFNAVFNAMGESKVPLAFLVFSSILNIVLDFVLVLRYNLGVAGVAYATLIAQGLSAVLSGGVLYLRLKRLETTEQFPIFSWTALKQMSKIAVPSMLQQSIVSIGVVAVQALVNSYGAVVIAGYTAATKIDNIAIMPMVSIGSAVSTFAAQNLGAKQPERVKKGYRVGVGMTFVLCLTILICLYFFGAQFVGMFMDSTSSKESIDIGVDYLKVVSLFYFFMGYMNVTNGVLRGSGDMVFFMVSTLTNFFSRVVFAYVLAHFLGAQAIWWSIPIGWFLGLTIAKIRYQSGVWKKSAVV